MLSTPSNSLGDRRRGLRIAQPRKALCEGGGGDRTAIREVQSLAQGEAASQPVGRAAALPGETQFGATIAAVAGQSFELVRRDPERGEVGYLLRVEALHLVIGKPDDRGMGRPLGLVATAQTATPA